MSNPSTLFSSQQFKSGTFNDWIIIIDDGSTTWYFSERTMRLGPVQTLDLLIKHSGIRNKIDPITSSWGVAGTTVTLSNAPYLKDGSGSYGRISDEFADIQGAGIQLLVADSTTGAIDPPTWPDPPGSVPGGFGASGLDSAPALRFLGTIADPITFDSKTVTIRAKSISESFNIGLPKLYAPAVFGDYDVPHRKFKQPVITRRIFQPTGTDMLPINYGVWTPSDHGNIGVGLAVGIPVSGSLVIPEVITSSHPMKAVEEVWFSQQNVDSKFTDGVQRFLTSTYITTNDQLGLVTPSSTAYMRVYPSGRFPILADVQVEGEPPDGETYHFGNDPNEVTAIIPWTPAEILLINDKDNTTFAQLKDSTDFRTTDEDWDDPNGVAFIYFTQGSNGVTFPNVGDELGRIVGTSFVEIYWTEEPGVNISNMSTMLLHRKNGGFGDMIVFVGNNIPAGSQQSSPFSSTNAGLAYPLNLSAHYGFDFTNNKTMPTNPSTQLDPFFPLVLVVRANNTDGSGYNGIQNDQSLARINTLNLKLEYEPEGINDFYVAASGSMYESWIEGRGGHSTGDLITDPAFIIEDILRTHIGLSTASIDTSSFSDAANSSVEARMNIHAENKSSVNTFIKQLAEQSTFAFCYASTGKARLIPLNDKTPVTSRIIPFSFIKNGKIRITKTPVYGNTLNIQHRYLQEEGGAYRDFSLFTNSVSQAAHGEETQDAAFENITGASVDHIGEHLVSNSDSLWANEHLQVEVELIGFTGIDLEIGDYVEFEASSCDPQVKPYGDSWAGKQFLIVEPTHKWRGTKLKLIQLYE